MLKLFSVDFWTPGISKTSCMFQCVLHTTQLLTMTNECCFLWGWHFFASFFTQLRWYITFVKEIRWRYKVFCQKRNVCLSNIGVQQKKGVIFQEEHCIFCQFANIWHFCQYLALFEEINGWAYLENKEKYRLVIF